jgi:hypothetical protein
MTCTCVSSIKLFISRLGSVVVSVLVTGPQGHRFKPSQGDGFLRVIKTTAHLSQDGK